MKYAIRLSHLPPAVLYITAKWEPDVVVKTVNSMLNLEAGVFHFVKNMLDWCEQCQVKRYVLVEDESTVVFTDPRDADYLVIPINGVYDIHKCN